MQKLLSVSKIISTFATRKAETTATAPIRSDARVAEEANLESLYTPKGYREFESPSLRKNVEWAHGSPQGPIAQLVRAPDS